MPARASTTSTRIPPFSLAYRYIPHTPLRDLPYRGHLTPSYAPAHIGRPSYAHPPQRLPPGPPSQHPRPGVPPSISAPPAHARHGRAHQVSTPVSRPPAHSARYRTSPAAPE